ncbi:MAG: twin-arginine translocation signal domain-containing protein [Candidatus Latescibacterota bacterium]
MDNRRDFLKKTAAAGIAGIVAAGVAPVYAQKVPPRFSPGATREGV